VVDCETPLLVTLFVTTVRPARRRTHCRGDWPKQTLDAITEDDCIDDSSRLLVFVVRQLFFVCVQLRSSCPPELAVARRMHHMIMRNYLRTAMLSFARTANRPG
jgi:hypothetical protein